MACKFWVEFTTTKTLPVLNGTLKSCDFVLICARGHYFFSSYLWDLSVFYGSYSCGYTISDTYFVLWIFIPFVLICTLRREKIAYRVSPPDVSATLVIWLKLEYRTPFTGICALTPTWRWRIPWCETRTEWGWSWPGGEHVGICTARSEYIRTYVCLIVCLTMFLSACWVCVDVRCVPTTLSVSPSSVM